MSKVNVVQLFNQSAVKWLDNFTCPEHGFKVHVHYGSDGPILKMERKPPILQQREVIILNGDFNSLNNLVFNSDISINEGPYCCDSFKQDISIRYKKFMLEPVREILRSSLRLRSR